MKCKICGNESNNKTYEVLEMMFGYRDKFKYFQCSVCKCLQIESIPLDMSKYYPENYYSFHSKSEKNFIKKKITLCRDHYALNGKGFFGKIIYRKFPREDLFSMHKLPITKESNIMDVGCGGGVLLKTLKSLGFKNLLGIDPFNEKDIEYKNGLKILKKNLREVEDSWDLIMFHHSFEHIWEQTETLITVSKMLRKDGVCLIRIPLVSSHAWRYYGVNWVQLDAPRHFFLHSIESMKLLCKNTGFEISQIDFDSTSFQFLGSEQYVHDIPLRDPRSYTENKKNSIFKKADFKKYYTKAKEYNAINQGDQAVFYLRKLK